MPPYPRVLVVAGASIRPAGNSGYTLYNLFRGWPAERLAQIYFEDTPPAPETCMQTWRLGLDQVPLDWLLRRSLRRFFRGEGRAPGFVPGAEVGAGAGQSSTARMKRHLRLAARAWMDWRASYRVSPALLVWARAFQPDAIYCLPGPLRPMRLEIRLADRLGVPMVPHFMDDWVSQLYRNTWLEYGPRQALARTVSAQLARCRFGLAISPAMAVDYEHRYGCPFLALMNCVAVPPAWPPPVAENKGRPLTLAYVGGLHLGRFESLLEIAMAVGQLKQQGCPAEIVGYDLRETPAQRAALEQTGVVRLAGALPGADALGCLREAAVLLYLEPFEQVAASYLRLSLSTKLPLYLAAGRAILARGASTLASMKYLAEAQAAATVTDPGRECLRQTLAKLLGEPGWRETLGRAAWQLARARHDAPSQRERFRGILAEAAAGRIPGPEFA